MLHQVVIVEDNPATVRSLVQTINWSELDCEIVGTAFDGAAGCRLILQCRPDIVLTDIRMPQMDGLDMIQKIRETLPECKVIIITGYDQFQYASRAIKLSVFDYLLKPINNDDVTAAVRRAVEVTRNQHETDIALEQTVWLRRRAQLFSLLTNDSQRGQGVYEMFTEMGLNFSSYYIMLVQQQDEQVYSQAIMRRIDAVLSRLNANTVTVLLYDAVVIFVMRSDDSASWRDQAALISQSLMNELISPVTIGVSKLTTSRHSIRQAYHQARQALWETVLSKRVACGFYQGEEEHPAGEGISDIHRRINELIENATLEETAAVEAARVIAEQSGGQYCNLRAMALLYVMALRKKFPCEPDEKVDAAIYGGLFVSSRQEAEQCLRKVSSALKNAREAHEKEELSLLTRNALQYIRLHSVEGFGLNDVAQKLCVSANYLSALIRKETGVTFHEHVLNAKMDVARTMLADPRILVEEVARAVGYGNYISFYNAFKRMEHMTPTEFRNKRIT